jgi:hypothetical protein
MQGQWPGMKSLEIRQLPTFAYGLVKKMNECGVDVKVLMKDWQQVLQMLEHAVLSDHMHKNKAEGKLMAKAEKKEFVSN